jgi:Ser/Thr protein kinase RdoA (MazF antagonist)
MARLPHGYTNQSRRLERHVEKTYIGTHRFENAGRELACLSSLGDRLPVATVIEADLAIPQLKLSVLPGDHGQDLIDGGHARIVLQLVGAALGTLQRLPVSVVPDLDGDGTVIVHGDFGPQNMLFDLDAGGITGVLDWEFAHRGGVVEDLAWAEWIVRMHHPRAVDALDSLFLGARCQPPWTTRHDEMLRRVRHHLAEAERTRSPSPWRHRLDATERWSE